MTLRKLTPRTVTDLTLPLLTAWSRSPWAITFSDGGIGHEGERAGHCGGGGVGRDAEISGHQGLEGSSNHTHVNPYNIDQLSRAYH